MDPNSSSEANKSSVSQEITFIIRNADVHYLTGTKYDTLFSPVRATWPVCFILLDLNTRIIFGEGYRS